MQNANIVLLNRIAFAGSIRVRACGKKLAEDDGRSTFACDIPCGIAITALRPCTPTPGMTAI
jgi:hypothetical protein